MFFSFIVFLILSTPLIPRQRRRPSAQSLSERKFFAGEEKIELSISPAGGGLRGWRRQDLIPQPLPQILPSSFLAISEYADAVDFCSKPNAAKEENNAQAHRNK